MIMKVKKTQHYYIFEKQALLGCQIWNWEGVLQQSQKDGGGRFQHFQTLRNKTKSVLSIKESYSLKKSQILQMPTVRLGVTPPLIMVSLTVNFPFSFFTPCLRRFCVSLNFTWSNWVGKDNCTQDVQCASNTQEGSVQLYTLGIPPPQNLTKLPWARKGPQI